MRERFDRLEILTDMTAWEHAVPASQPATNLQALMETAPDGNMPESVQAAAPTRAAVRRAMESLTVFEKFVIEAVYFEQLSSSQLGTRLGVSKSQAHRIKNVTIKTLTTYLQQQPQLRKVTMNNPCPPTDWEAAATEALITIEQNAAYSPIHVPFRQGLAAGIDYVNKGHKAVNIVDVDQGILDVAITAWLALDEDARNRMLPLLCDRQRKYGPNNILKFGTVGIVVRMSDKVERIANNSGDFMDDTVEDSYMDLVGYACIHWLCTHDYFELPLL